MALRVSYMLGVTLWLSLLLFMVHAGWYNLKSKNQAPSLLHHTVINRKVLATKFDFSPFLNNHNHDHHRHRVAQPEPDGSEVDERYGVEKRLVPTGPNPLHH
ncbi:hypothetical protein AQUCO_02600210v1 [Aquilegia coerulea]|uniref:Uncharacterized protein n=1 Tax=Aquilegia coerulea TaxID=218851 RepID=A0A2G5D7Y8_AQUCA|nr:hypothetical protein AQUCO_02600210v1 [Aquilegia coerulea]